MTQSALQNGATRTEDGQDAPRGSLTAEQLRLRADKLGASEAPAVVGLDPYRSGADVFLEKTGRAAPFAGNDATKRGQYQEPGLCMFAADETGVQFYQPVSSFIHPSGLLIATPDRLSADHTRAVEAKSTALTEGWGEPGTDQIPEKVLVQVAQQFLCVPTLQIVYVPVELIGFKSIEWELYQVERKGPGVADLIAWVEEQGIRFMRDFVRADRQPDDFRPSLEVLKRVRRVPKKFIEIDPALVNRLEAAKEKGKAIETEIEKAQSYLLAAMGDAEGATYDGGKVTYMEVHRKEFVSKACTYRSLRITPATKKKLPPAPVEQPPMLGDDEISGAIDQASGAVFSDADGGL